MSANIYITLDRKTLSTWLTRSGKSEKKGIFSKKRKVKERQEKKPFTFVAWKIVTILDSVYFMLCAQYFIGIN